MATLRDYFETDFGRDFVVSNGWRFKIGGGEVVVQVELHLDFDANARFLSCYVPHVLDPVGVIEAVSARIDHAFAMIEGKGIRVGKHGERQVGAEELVFAGRIFVYGEDELDEATLDRLAASLKARNMALRYRGPSYARERSAFEHPLAFISYDFSDREAVAAPLAHALVAIRCETWFDAYSMRPGDRLESTMMQGLEECERCIVVLSPAYLANQRWARREFEAIADREAREGRALIIPLRCGATQADVDAFSPSLGDRRSLEWDPRRAAAIASEISITLLAVGRPYEKGGRGQGGRGRI